MLADVVKHLGKTLKLVITLIGTLFVPDIKYVYAIFGLLSSTALDKLWKIKACDLYFYILPKESISKITKKTFLLHLKISVCSQIIQIFAIFFLAFHNF